MSSEKNEKKWVDVNNNSRGKKSYKLVSDQAKKAKILDYGEIHKFFSLLFGSKLIKSVLVCLRKYAYEKIKNGTTMFQFSNFNV